MRPKPSRGRGLARAAEEEPAVLWLPEARHECIMNGIEKTHGCPVRTWLGPACPHALACCVVCGFCSPSCHDGTVQDMWPNEAAVGEEQSGVTCDIACDAKGTLRITNKRVLWTAIVRSCCNVEVVHAPTSEIRLCRGSVLLVMVALSEFRYTASISTPSKQTVGVRSSLTAVAWPLDGQHRCCCMLWRQLDEAAQPVLPRAKLYQCVAPAQVLGLG